MIKYEELIKLVTYDPETGTLTRINKGKNGKGAIHGYINKDDGYIRFGLKGETYLGHRIAWMLYYREWPRCQVDHINGDRSDNSIKNLRNATNSENSQNRKSENRLGKGVARRPSGRFQSKIIFNGTTRHLGTFGTPEEAAAAYKAAADMYHGEFACTDQAEAGA